MKLPSWPDPKESKVINLGLDRIFELLARLDNPHLKLPPTIHVAGTNGKGSVIAFLKAILEENKYKVHIYTSPHLVNFNERIIISGKQISDQYLDEIITECKNAALQEPEIKVTFFEATTVVAFLAFSRNQADILLLETGMGGRLDATNCIPKVLMSIITPISIDHQEFLGKVISKIAYEKSGIIKNNCPVVIAKQRSTVLKLLKAVALKKNSSTIICQKDWWVKKYSNYFVIDFSSTNIIKKLRLPIPSLAGHHQLYNASTAITALLSQKQLKIDPEKIKDAITKANWPARLQKITDGKFFDLLAKHYHGLGIKYELILDGSHNEAGSKTIKSWLKTEKKVSTYLIFGMVEDKNCKKYLANLKDYIDHLIAIPINNDPKSKNPKEIYQTAKDIGISSSIADNFDNAFKKVTELHNSKQNFRVIVCGSLYLAGWFLDRSYA